jgi:hypothetical protein
VFVCCICAPKLLCIVQGKLDSKDLVSYKDVEEALNPIQVKLESALDEIAALKEQIVDLRKGSISLGLNAQREVPTPKRPMYSTGAYNNEDNTDAVAESEKDEAARRAWKNRVLAPVAPNTGEGQSQEEEEEAPPAGRTAVDINNWTSDAGRNRTPQPLPRHEEEEDDESNGMCYVVVIVTEFNTPL